MPDSDRAQAGDRVDQLGLAVAVDAGDADDLAGVDGRATSPSTAAQAAVVVDAEVATSAPARSGSPAASRRAAAPRARPSSARALARSRPRSSTVPTFLPRRSTVTRSAIASTSSSLCEMKTIDSAVARAAPSRTSNSSSVSWAVSTAVGSSRTRICAPRYSALQDLDALLLADACCPRRARRGRPRSPYRSASSRTRSSRPRRRRAAGPCAARRPSTMFSATVITGIEHEVLVHHADARASIASRGRRRCATGSPSTRISPSSGLRARRGRSSASTCPRRSPRAGRGSRRRRRSKSTSSLATSAPKRLVMPRSSSGRSRCAGRLAT